jgi:hypothetical protein
VTVAAFGSHGDVEREHRGGERPAGAHDIKGERRLVGHERIVLEGFSRAIHGCRAPASWASAS